MATIYRCDKCDGESPMRTFLRTVSISNNPSSTIHSDVELCERCISRLKDWLRPDAKEMLKGA